MKRPSMPPTPLLSVIIPSHNCLDYLPQAIQSVQQQSVRSMEIVVVDDGSTDNTAAWLTEAQKEDGRIRVLTLDGIGASGARNHAISLCRGRYVAFLDADDYWTCDHLGQQLDFHLENPRLAMSFMNYRHISMAGDDRGDCFTYWPRFAAQTRHQQGFAVVHNGLTSLFAENVVGTSTVMARHNALQNAKGFDETLQSASDWDLWIRLALHGFVACNPQVVCDYRMQRPGSITRQATVRLQSLESIIQRYRHLVQHMDPSAIHSAMARVHVARAELAREQGRIWPSLGHQTKAWATLPNRRSSGELAGCIKAILQHGTVMA